MVVVMAWHFAHLQPSTRQHMISEIAFDENPPRTLYLGKQLSPTGRVAYPSLLREAATNHAPEWFGQALAVPGTFDSHFEYTRAGKLVRSAVPADAPARLAGGEFNRFYMRGVCLRALAEEVSALEVYRALDVANPRAESQAALGKIVGPEALLEDLRLHPGTTPLHALPGGPNSGLSVKFAA